MAGRGRALRADAVAGVPGAIASVPDGMASAVLVGVNPVYGLYVERLVTVLPEQPTIGASTAEAQSAAEAWLSAERESPHVAEDVSVSG